MTSVEERAREILFSTYWSSTGWRPRSEQRLSHEDFAYAKAAGLMFDPVFVDHDDVVQLARRLAREIPARAVADAFVASLASRRLELRSALGSFAVLRHLPEHRPVERDGRCRVCGWFLSPFPQEEDPSLFNFERLKWGGLRHLDLAYASFDLAQFAKLPAAAPSREAVELLRALLESIEGAPAGTSAAKLGAALPKEIRSNADERAALIGVLGLCGVLRTEGHPSFRRAFVPALERRLPARRFGSTAYPACWWVAPDGLDREAVGEWFGHLLGSWGAR